MPPHEICRRAGGASLVGSSWITLVTALVLILPAPARAASEAELDGAHVTLRALEDGTTLRAVLDIDLKPGWKTYWISPGAAGLAPRIDFGASEGLSPPHLAYPAPTRFREGEIESIGYTEPVSFAIEADRVEGRPAVLRAQILLGLCRDLCLPVQLELEAEPTASLATRAAVRRAAEAMPDRLPSKDGWRATLSADSRQLLVHGPSAKLASARDLFVAAPDGWAFGSPVVSPNEEGTATLSVLSAPGGGSSLDQVDLVLTNTEKGEQIPAVPVGRD